ncbi:MAG: hypothetical protein HY901_37745 [Deltaproteobacteria bacterium]|nr:hypothetical protein [Deltaproteobacteria bacterium]
MTTNARRALLIGSLALAALVAACDTATNEGGGGGGGAPDAGAPDAGLVDAGELDGGLPDSGSRPDAGLPGSPDTGLGPFVIVIRDFTFIPTNLVVPPGAFIIVKNEDGVPHSATSQSASGQFLPGPVDGIAFDTGIFLDEARFSIPLSALKGTRIPYFCRVQLGAMRNDPVISVE